MAAFTDLSLNYGNYEYYFHRGSILHFIQSNAQQLKGRLLDIGCGKKPYKDIIMNNSDVKQYVGLDIENSLNYGGENPEITWNGNKIPVEDNSFDSALATEVFEHVNNIQEVLEEVYRVLVPGAVMLITVPFIWPLHETPHDHFRYTPFSMEKLLKDAGFREVTVKGLGGWNAAMGQMLALWSKRAYRKKLIKLFLFVLSYPIVWILFRTDKKPDLFKESSMITGLEIIVRK